jgi:MATE family multidrug resistance protein
MSPPAQRAALSLFRDELVALLRLALPLIGVSAGFQLMGMVDTAVVGRLSQVALGAVGLANGVYFTLAVLGLGLMMGMDPLIAQALGAGDRTRVRYLLSQAVWLACGTSLVLTLPMLLLPPLFFWAGIPGPVAEMASAFFYPRVLSLFPTLLFAAARSYLQAVGRTRPLIAGIVLANVVNLLGDLLLVFGGQALPGWTGFLRQLPALGVRGSALATVFSITALTAFLLAALVRSGELKFMRPERLPLLEATRVGLPAGLQMLAEVGVFALAGVVVGRLGAEPLAAHQVALQLASLTFMGAYGLQGASSVRVGLRVGAGDAPGIRRAGKIGLLLGGVWMGICALALAVFPAPFARLLTDQVSVLAAALPLIRVAAAFQLSDGLQAVSTGVLRGAGDARFPFLANLAGHYLVGLPLGLSLAGAGFGAAGVWWGLALGLTLVAVTLVVRFWRLSARPIRPLHSDVEDLPDNLGTPSPIRPEGSY